MHIFFIVIKSAMRAFFISLIFTAAGLCCFLEANAQSVEIPDTVVLSEVSISAVKQGLSLKGAPVASTIIGRSQIEELNIMAIKGISDLVPNFYIPDYGSRITSSIYVRGIGARMDQPAVGLNIDNVPFLNKDAYDFDVADIARVEVIRGPQSTLYGRNTMGGLINITTLSPLDWQGIRGIAEYGSANTWRLGTSYYHRFAPNFGLAASIGYQSSDGFFTNQYNGKKLDKERQWTARLKAAWRPTPQLTFSNALAFSRLRQGGYPYESIKSGVISFNDTCFYKRLLINDGLTVHWNSDSGITLTSITSLQYINDNLTLDQDFLPLDYFTLTQKKHEIGFTQDIVVNGKAAEGKYSWLAGAFMFHKNLNMDAPVTFHDYGIRTLIEDHRNSANPDYPISWHSRSFPLNSEFRMPTWGIAAYHQSNLDLGSWHLAAGVRIDYERTSMDYHSFCNTGYDILRPADNSIYNTVAIDIDDYGSLSRHFLEVLPSISALWDLPSLTASNIYARISKGYKAGGFNTQMFSDVLQQRLMNIMGIGSKYDVDDVVGYKPEKSWNYELGSHLEFFNSRLAVDAALFFIDCTDQQLTVFPDGTTTGRIMTNAGKTRSMGGEISVRWHAVKDLDLSASYGYTNARFRKFFNGINDFSGKYVPYAPQNTLFLQALYRLSLNSGLLKELNFDVNLRGTGKIFWNEDNSFTQNFYALLNASVTAVLPHAEVQIWANNITNTHYSTFYFLSIGNEFIQRGKPFSAGVTIRLNF